MKKTYEKPEIARRGKLSALTAAPITSGNLKSG